MADVNKVSITITILEMCILPSAGERGKSGNERDTKIRERNR